jgi:hypothetical protein
MNESRITLTRKKQKLHIHTYTHTLVLCGVGVSLSTSARIRFWGTFSSSKWVVGWYLRGERMKKIFSIAENENDDSNTATSNKQHSPTERRKATGLFPNNAYLQPRCTDSYSPSICCCCISFSFASSHSCSCFSDLASAYTPNKQAPVLLAPLREALAQGCLRGQLRRLQKGMPLDWVRSAQW